jgi:hypothetical protein
MVLRVGIEYPDGRGGYSPTIVLLNGFNCTIVVESTCYQEWILLDCCFELDTALKQK